MSADVKKKPSKVVLASGVIRKKPAPLSTKADATPKPSSAKEKIVRALKKLHPME